MRTLPIFLAFGLAAASAAAQNSAAPISAAVQDSGAIHQRSERIRIEDGGSRVDELRIGGQTRSITVQPKIGDMPAYQIQNHDGARAARQREDRGGTRLWTIGNF